MNAMLSAAGNPLMPNSFDLVWTLVVVAGLVLFIAGLVFVSKLDQSPQVKLLLALLVLVLPVVGSLGVIWLYVTTRTSTPASPSR